MQEYFVYFKIFKPISWGKRPAERRSQFNQRFPRKASAHSPFLPLAANSSKIASFCATAPPLQTNGGRRSPVSTFYAPRHSCVPQKCPLAFASGVPYFRHCEEGTILRPTRQNPEISISSAEMPHNSAKTTGFPCRFLCQAVSVLYAVRSATLSPNRLHFKGIARAVSWGKRPADHRSRLIQRFPSPPLIPSHF